MLPPDENTDAVIQGYKEGSCENSFVEALKDWMVGTVELTRNGYDMSAAIAETRELTTNFFSIAASYEKIMLEGDSIVLVCIDALSQVLYSTGVSLRNRNVLIMGARGNLGRLSVNHLSNMLADSTKQLWCCDVKVDWPPQQPGSVPAWAEWAASDKKNRTCCDGSIRLQTAARCR